MRLALLGLLVLAGCAASSEGEEEAGASADAALQASEAGDGFLARARADGSIGEKLTGYVGVVDGVGASDALTRSVADINIKRRAVYTDLAVRRHVTVETAAKATACVLYRDRVAVGQWFEAEAGGWERRAAGVAVTLPSFCADLL